ncbi:unnamed protein product [Schistosoma mattheei]|uniref:Uncharacterized protein n=1 Tax=Schistosoma mattheei TaxID=31246 RepID=A0A3P8GJX1_9TREM|nr:unnamed protein product [Schistosoma mattheei]
MPVCRISTFPFICNFSLPKLDSKRIAEASVLALPPSSSRSSSSSSIAPSNCGIVWRIDDVVLLGSFALPCVESY